VKIKTADVEGGKIKLSLKGVGTEYNAKEIDK
jgi:hypothetical protein